MRGKKSPNDRPDWQEKFRQQNLGFTLQIKLSKSMLEMICAVADNVDWDRGLWKSQENPDNFLATIRALERRGLVERKSPEEVEAHLNRPARNTIELHSGSVWKLTPIGEALVELLKVAGLFVEAEVATMNREAN